MTEKEWMKTALAENAPDFDAIEKRCLQELRPKKALRKWLLPVAAVLALTLLSFGVLRLLQKSPTLPVSPTETASPTGSTTSADPPTVGPTDYPTELPLEFPEWPVLLPGELTPERLAAMKAAVAVGTPNGGDADAPYRLARYANGAFFAPGEMIDGTDFCPSLNGLSLLNAASSDREIQERKTRMLDDLNTMMLERAYAPRPGDPLTETDAYAFEGPIAVDYPDCAAAYVFTLTAKIGDDLRYFAATNDETSLTYLRDTPADLLSDPDFLRFAQAYGVRSPRVTQTADGEARVTQKRGEEMTPEEYYGKTVFVRTNAQGQTTLFCKGPSSWSTEDDYAPVPPGAKAVKTETAKAQAFAEAKAQTASPEEEYLGCTVQYYPSKDLRFNVPCYCFWFRLSEEGDSVSAARVLIPAWDITEVSE